VASLWTEQKIQVTATTRTPAKLSELAKIAQKGVLLKGDEPEELIPLVQDNETILVTVAADSPKHYESAYLKTAQHLRKVAYDLQKPRHLIYTSSASVYGDHQGLWVDEEVSLLGKGPNIEILIEAEKIYLSLASQLGWTVSIFRLGEIYGSGREISKKLLKYQKSPLPGSGNHYTNMVHQIDCARAIDLAFIQKLAGIYNLADDDHPTQKELYDTIAEKFNLPKPIWDPTLPPIRSGNKRISNHKIKKVFKFQHPHRLLD
jgi:nucleoside-diphosphate-sugar epimerase